MPITPGPGDSLIPTEKGKIISRHGLKPDYRKLKGLDESTPPTRKKELWGFLGIIKYQQRRSMWFNKMSNIDEGIMNMEFQLPKTIQQSKIFIEDVHMEFYNETKPLYLDTDTSGVGLGATLL